MSELNLEQAVAEFLHSAEQGVPYPPAWFGRLDMAQAFQLQLAIRDAKAAAGEAQVGWKVGLTAKAIQEQFHCHEPVFGYLQQAGLHRSGASIETASLVGPGFENEICFLLRDDLRGPGVTFAEASQALECIFPALELVENRGDLSAQLEVAIADNVQQTGFVLGEPLPWNGALDLASVNVLVRINQEEVARGRGDAVLGHPLNSLVWLANKLAEFGQTIRAGQYVMAGSFTRQFPLRIGDRIETVFDQVGEVRLQAC